MLFNFQDARNNASRCRYKNATHSCATNPLRKLADFLAAQFSELWAIYKGAFAHFISSFRSSEVLGLVQSAYLLYHIQFVLSSVNFVNSFWTVCERLAHFWGFVEVFRSSFWAANIFILPLFKPFVKPSFVKDLWTAFELMVILLSFDSYSLSRSLRSCCVFRFSLSCPRVGQLIYYITFRLTCQQVFRRFFKFVGLDSFT